MDESPLEFVPEPAAKLPPAARTPPQPRNEAEEIAKFVAQLKQLADELPTSGIDRGEAKLLARAFRELTDSFVALRHHRQRRKVVVFGSARIAPDSPIYQLAIDFGRKAAAAGYMVVTGAGLGIMEAAHVGAGRAMSIGFNIELPFEQKPNSIIDGDPKLRTFNYFFTRKLMFMKEADALVLFPGGLGTMDECFEALTLIQTGKSACIPLVMVDVPGGRYWEHFIEYVHHQLFMPGMISEEDLAFFRNTHSAGEAIEEIVTFYRVYHSQRFIGKHLVLRLQKPISDALLHRLNREFADVLESETVMEVRGAHPHESNEPDVAHLPRLYLHFNRRSTGKLRELIDWLNREVV